MVYGSENETVKYPLIKAKNIDNAFVFNGINFVIKLLQDIKIYYLLPNFILFVFSRCFIFFKLFNKKIN